ARGGSGRVQGGRGARARPGEGARGGARQLGAGRAASALVPLGANTIVAMAMLGADGILPISAVSMPGSAPVVRLMMYPDGHRLGAPAIVASLGRAFGQLARVCHDLAEARHVILGDV